MKSSLFLHSIEKCLGRLGNPQFYSLCMVLPILYSLFFFSPKINLWLGPPLDGTYEWSRALTILEQSKSPLEIASVREPAMKWRVLPALVSHFFDLGITGLYLLPWIGICLLLGTSAGFLSLFIRDRVSILLVLLILSTTGPFITCTNLVGINDAWAICGLIAVVFSRNPQILLVTSILTPWVDERFLIALPLALFCRTKINLKDKKLQAIYFSLLGAFLYLGVRFVFGGDVENAKAGDYVIYAFKDLFGYWRWIPFGWFMGFRAAWLILLVPLFLLKKQPKDCLFFLFGILMTLGTITVLAADTTRSVWVLMPSFWFGVFCLAKKLNQKKIRAFLSCILAINTLMPFVWITHAKGWPVMPLPLEILANLINK